VVLGRALLVPLAAVAVAFGACGGSAAQPSDGPGTTTTAPTRAPQVITAGHHLRTFRLARGRDVELRLASGALLKSAGRSVSVTQIDFVVDPGYTAWHLVAVAPGRTVVTARAGAERFRLTLVVPG
jgi:hypothetical protein